MATTESRSMVSETSICNQALSWCGANSINSMEDETAEGEWCRDNYPFLRDAVLEEMMWTFATDRIISGPVTDTDGWGDMFKHQLPLDWISAFRVYRNISNRNRPLTSEGWRREGRYILTHEDTVYLWGIKRVTDTGQFSPMFVQALAYRLAAEMAVPFTENMQLSGYYTQKYGAALAEAATRDGQQGSNEQVQSNSLIDARAGGYGIS